MDPRRFLILAGLGLSLSGCAVLSRTATPPTAAPRPLVAAEAAAIIGDQPLPQVTVPVVEPASDPTPLATDTVGVAYEAQPEPAATATALTGRRAIVAANLDARAPSRSDAFVGGVQVFAWSPGRVFEVWTAPLRVTTLTLGAGETLVSKAAGDTVRWQIGETSSGDGAGQRTHVLLKPLQRGLETNLVLTTNRRVYFIDLRSGDASGFNAAIAWDAGAMDPPAMEPIAEAAEMRVSDPVAMPEGPIDARYRIEPQGRRARWTPASVFNDGQRTFIAFDPDLQIDEAPALFVIAADGETQMVNYRQAGGLFIVDRVFDRAELRLGDRRPQIVRIRRLQGAAR
ncbi:P-type conjugative transfer protein TrbG [Brevundimonas fontaquae]|uniref:P-type conjugative transfer protein TrbG n=1 Tax=Brevundimonas fontaquae TaxID=2813778 RepID=A0ABX7LPU1_9CAUL|nr:P-type conjugative transfer protein TrbG [Brevundimonas fontaquae]QSF54856.1 P-type conjugative transfer protein TrbG [Brevundimonas fontaquae]